MIDQDDRVAARLVIQLGQLLVLTRREPTDLAGRPAIVLSKFQPGLLAMTKVAVGGPTTAKSQADHQQEGGSINFTNS